MTPAQSIIAFLESTDYESAVRGAISLGGDADATRPQSSIDDKGFNIIFQSAAMYFNAIGATWLCVWADAKKLARSESSEPA
jgi:hypothetical protein